MYILCLGISGPAVPQQANQWFFGLRAGLDFNSGLQWPGIITEGIISTYEGCASICDENGKVLFYSDGVYAYNRLHQVMLNGSGLKGNTSSYQACIIVPKPGFPNIFYLFTADSKENRGANGYNYSEINMTLNNGNGGITSNKNIFLSGPSSERLTASMAANYIDYWVITNDWNSNIFRSYKVSCQGIDLNSVISRAGKVTNESDNANIGAIKVSPDGKWLCQTNNRLGVGGSSPDEYAQLFRFNNNTGEITDAVIIPIINEGNYFGCEFSSDSRYLYLTNPYNATVHQYDLNSGIPVTILASRKIILTSNGRVGAMQLGPDGKIYIANNLSSVHAIRYPGKPGVECGMVEMAVDLKGRQSVLGLTAFVPNFFANRPAEIEFEILDSCEGTVQFKGINRVAGAQPFWEFGDGTTSLELNPVHVFPEPNKSYLVKLRLMNDLVCGDYVSSKWIVPGGAFLRAGFGLEADCESRTVHFLDSSVSSSSNLVYHWDFGDGNSSSEISPVHTYASLSNYQIQLVISGAGCIADSVTRSLEFQILQVDAGPDRDVVRGHSIQLTATGAQTYNWSPPDFLDHTDIPNPLSTPEHDITYMVHGTNGTGCEGADSVHLRVLKDALLAVPNAFTPNGDGLNDRFRPILGGINQLDYFRIYDRWGGLVFETNKIGEGWDGRRNGKLLDAGNYAWVLLARNIDGVRLFKKGTVMLIK